MTKSISALSIKINNQDTIAEIRKDAWYIERVEKTPERCMTAVKQNGLVLKAIPKNLHTVDLCLEAVKQNAYAIKNVSKRCMTEDICLEAVRKLGSIISHTTAIPDEFRTEKLYLEAIKQSGRALEYIPNKYKSESVCIKSIMQNGLALEFVPKNTITKNLNLLAVEQNGLALQFVRSNSKTKGLCITAVNNNPLALKYVPGRFKGLDLCNAAIKMNWQAFLYVPESMYTLDRCLEIFEQVFISYNNPCEVSYDDRNYIREIAGRLPEDINNDLRIIRLERQLGIRCFKEKSYDHNTNKFITKEYIYYMADDSADGDIKEFETFIDFYEYLDGNLEEANLHDFNFHGINLSDFSIEGAYISSTVLVEQNMYDDSFYAENIKDDNGYVEMKLSAENEVVDAISILHESDIDSNFALNDNTCKMYYISDIHLNHKLLDKFPQYATQQEVTIYIRQLIEKMLETAVNRSPLDDYLLVVGDTSFSFELSKLFYTELSKQWESTSKIVVVLGNHELWDFNRDGTSCKKTNSLDDIINHYRDLFADLKICFLQNDLLISNGIGTRIIPEDQLESIDSDELNNLCLKSSIIMLGGLGYSGLNPVFNATQGIYRNTIKTLQEDIEQTKRFETVYSKINHALNKDRVIILTHMPKENWSNKTYNSKWIYVNGHTHRNDYTYNDEKTVYADNQIGYTNTSIGLKQFSSTRIYDIFRYYIDGIYNISREQYLDFNRGVKINITFNRTNGTISMLKKHGIYCFVFEKESTGELYLLNGGMLNKLQHSNLNYYFSRMVYYSDAIKGLFTGYNQALKLISSNIKKIGGLGTVHGCIVDVDFYNHIYVNPQDGTITPYYATSIIDKYVYNDVGTLLMENRQDLYYNYSKLLDCDTKNLELLNGESKAESIATSQFVLETHMYRLSRIMRSLQYLTEVNVIRIWNDRIMDIQPCIEDGTRQPEKDN